MVSEEDSPVQKCKHPELPYQVSYRQKLSFTNSVIFLCLSVYSTIFLTGLPRQCMCTLHSSSVVQRDAQEIEGRGSKRIQVPYTPIPQVTVAAFIKFFRALNPLRAAFVPWAKQESFCSVKTQNTLGTMKKGLTPNFCSMAELRRDKRFSCSAFRSSKLADVPVKILRNSVFSSTSWSLV